MRVIWPTNYIDFDFCSSISNLWPVNWDIKFTWPKKGIARAHIQRVYLCIYAAYIMRLGERRRSENRSVKCDWIVDLPTNWVYRRRWLISRSTNLIQTAWKIRSHLEWIFCFFFSFGWVPFFFPSLAIIISMCLYLFLFALFLTHYVWLVFSLFLLLFRFYIFHIKFWMIAHDNLTGTNNRTLTQYYTPKDDGSTHETHQMNTVRIYSHKNLLMVLLLLSQHFAFHVHLFSSNEKMDTQP